VVLYHISNVLGDKFDQVFLAGIFSVGYVGVDFFFVLSGFIICYVHYRDIGIRSSLKAFLIKRLVRIFPIYWAICAVLVAVYFIFPSFGSEEYRNVPLLVRSILLFPEADPRPLPVSWTLSFEMFFYMVFSLFMLVKTRVVVGGLVLWGGVSLCYALGIIPKSESYLANFIINGLNVEFLLGCLVAYLVLKYQRTISGRTSACIFVLGTLLVVLSWYLRYAHLTSLHRAILFGPSFALLVLGVALYDVQRAPRLPKMLLGIGDASYSIYLTHCDLVTLVLKLLAVAGLAGLMKGQLIALGVAVAVVFAGWLCYKLVEKPILDLLRKKLLPRPALRVEADVTEPLADVSRKGMKI